MNYELCFAVYLLVLIFNILFKPDVYQEGKKTTKQQTEEKLIGIVIVWSKNNTAVTFFGNQMSLRRSRLHLSSNVLKGIKFRMV